MRFFSLTWACGCAIILHIHIHIHNKRRIPYGRPAQGYLAAVKLFFRWAAKEVCTLTPPGSGAPGSLAIA